MKHAMSILYVIVLLLFATMTAATTPMNSESELEHFTSLADDDHTNQNFVVSLNSSDHVIWNLFQSDGMYWDFEVTDPPSGPDQIITFFICDQENYDFWISGESASVYHLQENVTSYSSEFTIPYTLTRGTLSSETTICIR